MILLVTALVVGGCAKPASAPTPAPTPTPTPEPAEPIKLKAVSFVPVMSVTAQKFKEFLDGVSDKSNGELEIELIGGPETIPGLELPEALEEALCDHIARGLLQLFRDNPDWVAWLAYAAGTMKR